MHPTRSRLLLRGYDCGCYGSVEALGLGLLVVVHPSGDDFSQLLAPLCFFDFAAVVDDDDLPGCGLLEVLLLQWPWIGCHEARTKDFVSQAARQHVWRGV